jgi:hypothetical protein
MVAVVGLGIDPMNAVLLEQPCHHGAKRLGRQTAALAGSREGDADLGGARLIRRDAHRAVAVGDPMCRISTPAAAGAIATAHGAPRSSRSPSPPCARSAPGRRSDPTTMKVGALRFRDLHEAARDRVVRHRACRDAQGTLDAGAELLELRPGGVAERGVMALGQRPGQHGLGRHDAGEQQQRTVGGESLREAQRDVGRRRPVMADDDRAKHGSGPREVGEAMLAGRVLADVGNARLGQAQQFARVEEHAMAMIAGGAHDPLAIENPDVHDLGQRDGAAERGQRADLEAGEGDLDLLLRGQAQVPARAQRDPCPSEVQSPGGRDDRQAVAVVVVQHERLGAVGRLDADGVGLLERAEGRGMLDQLVLDAGLVEETRQPGAG